MKKNAKNAFSIFAFTLATIISLAAAFLPEVNSSLSVATSIISYWTNQFIVITSCFLLCSIFGKKILCKIRSPHRSYAILVSLLATLFLFTRENPGFKVYFDEPILSNVALNIHESREAVATGSSLHRADHVAVAKLDKRPVLFPTLLANVHDLLGYRIANVFYLNGFVSMVLLLLVYLINREFSDQRAGLISIILCAASPLIATNSNGGGFDLLNATILAAVFLFALDFSKDPTSKKQTLLFFLAAALANTRYESFIYIAPVAGTVILISIKKRKLFGEWIQTLVPLLFIPTVWAQRESLAHAKNWYQNENSKGIFSLDYIPENFVEALKFFFVPNANFASNPVISIISIASLVFLIFNMALKRTDSRKLEPYHYVTGFFIIGLFLYAILMLSYFWSAFTDPVASRLALPILISSILIASAGINAASTAKGPFIILVSILLVAIYAFTMYSKHTYTKNNAIPDYLSYIDNYIKEKADKNALYISRFQSYLELRKVNNISINQANAAQNKLAMHSPNALGTYSAVYAIQLLYIDPDDPSAEKKPLPGWDLSGNFKLDIETEASFLPFNYLRISKVADIVGGSPPIEPYPYDRFSYKINPDSTRGWIQSLP